MTHLEAISDDRADRWLRILAERSDQIYQVISLDPLEILYISPAFEHIWKMPVAIAKADPMGLFNTIIAEDRDRVAGVFESLIAGRLTRYDINYRITDGDGAIRWIRDTGSVVSPDGSDKRVILCVAEDSTELHNSAYTLRQRLEWHDLMTEQVPVSLWTTDRDLRFTSTAGSGLAAAGTKPNELVGMSLFEYLHTRDEEHLPIRAHLSALNGEELEYDYEIEQIKRTYHTKLRPFRDSKGDIIGVIGIAFDITELKRAEVTIQESTETYRTLIEFNPELVALVVDGKLAYVNESLRRVIGYEPSEMIGHSPVEFVIPEDRPFASERIRAVMAGEPPTPTEYRTIRKDGVVRNIEVLAQRISYRGKPALVAFIHDITARKEAEDQLRRHGQELEVLIDERTSQVRELERQRSETDKLAATGQMAARIAHEINNPLAGIKSAFRLIRGAVPPSHPHFEFVGLIDREIERIANIVQLMFRLYRPGQVLRERVDLDACIRDVVSLISLTAEQRGVHITIGEIHCLQVLLPVGQVQQILFNLIQNSLEASPDGATVEITAGPAPRGIVICVSDRGPGVPSELQDRIFEPFFSTKTVGGSTGLGLGLSVTRSLAESIDGTVEYSNRPGGGAIFTVVLPSDCRAKEL